MTTTLRTYPVDLNPPPGLPSGVWDPAWEKPEVAARVARHTYRQLRAQGMDGGPLRPASELPRLAKRNTEHRAFALGDAQPIPDLNASLRGGSYGEIFRRYAFGPRPAANFHAQAVSFGVDSDGRYFVDGQIGLVGGAFDNEAALVVRFVGKRGAIGGVAWQGPVASEQNFHLQILGSDDRLRDSFDKLSEIQVDFYAKCTGA